MLQILYSGPTIGFWHFQAGAAPNPNIAQVTTLLGPGCPAYLNLWFTSCFYKAQFLEPTKRSNCTIFPCILVIRNKFQQIPPYKTVTRTCLWNASPRRWFYAANLFPLVIRYGQSQDGCDGKLKRYGLFHFAVKLIADNMVLLKQEIREETSILRLPASCTTSLYLKNADPLGMWKPRAPVLNQGGRFRPLQLRACLTILVSK